MHRILFLLVCLVLPFAMFAQIGVNTTNPDTSSILDISSTNKGLLIPRMSTGDRQSISKARNSLLVYDSTNARYMYCLNNVWYELNPISAPFTHDSVTITKKLSLGDPSNPTGLKLTVNGSAVVKEGIVAKQVTTTSISTQNLLTTNITATGKISVNEIALPNTGMGLVPKGVIVMWSGALSDIPVGWALCDGQNGTPDLGGRFIVGSGQNASPTARETTNPTYSIGDKGGVNSYSLSINEIPSHDHGGGNHSHSIDGWVKNSGNNSGLTGKLTNQDGSTQTTFSGNIISIQGGGLSHENRPPFYVLAYIIKL